MRYFDLHCDTLGACLYRHKDLLDNGMQISLEKGAFSEWTQCFAIFIPDEKRGEEAVRMVEEAHALLEKNKREHPERLVSYSSPAETSAARAIFTIEGGGALGGKMENLERFYEMGVRMMTLTWNGACELGDGVMAKEYGGLSPFGKEVVRRMETLPMAIDISHASEATFYDTASAVSAPLVASHSNAKTVCGHPRNLSDEQFSEIVRRKGLVGLNFFTAFLEDDESKAGVQSVIKHAEHFLSLGGEDVLAMGSDFDGAVMSEDLNGIEKVPGLYEAFLKANYSEALVDKIFYGNARAFFDRMGNML